MVIHPTHSSPYQKLSLHLNFHQRICSMPWLSNTGSLFVPLSFTLFFRNRISTFLLYKEITVLLCTFFASTKLGLCNSLSWVCADFHFSRSILLLVSFLIFKRGVSEVKLKNLQKINPIIYNTVQYCRLRYLVLLSMDVIMLVLYRVWVLRPY